MTSADLDEVLEIERASFPEPWSRGMFLHELKVPFSKSIVARADDPPHAMLGYVCRWLVGDAMEILNVAVRPDQRQHGIGRVLVQLVLEEATAHAVASVTLEVRRGNTAAIALYHTLGFTDAGLRRNYYGQGADAILMTWTPAPQSVAAVAGP